MRKTIVVIVIAAALLAGCTKTGSSGVQDGTRWNEADGGQWPSKTDAVTLVQKAQEAQP